MKKNKTDFRYTTDGLGWICSSCGASNPSKGDICVNCEEGFSFNNISPIFLTPEEYIVYKIFHSSIRR